MIIPSASKHSNHLRSWEPDELDRLRQLVQSDVPFPLISAMLGRSEEALRTKARKLGITNCPCCKDKLPGSGGRKHR